ncbi:MAG: PspC domain-containing protein [Spirochaetaceae bacterium]|jgi:phage shock protein C|nr:PspC domain-containing protein [Spirochaetaceae bacterium]
MKLYRSREGKLFGVCQGIADATGYSVKYIRIAAVLVAFFTAGWALAAYGIAAFILPVQRPEGYESKGFRENFEDLRDDAESFVKKEYSDLKEAGAEASKKRKERKGSSKGSEPETKIDPEKA